MSWDRDTIAKFSPRPKKEAAGKIWDGYVDAMVEHGEELFAEFGIDTGLELQHFMAQIAHESGGFTIIQESMSYRPERIMEIFGQGKHSANVTTEEALSLGGNPQALAERVYGLGNPRKARELGNTEPGDGFKYIGLGLIQITGRADHEKYFAGDYSARQMFKAALMEFTDKGCNDLASQDNCKAITRKINGGFNGLEDRKVWLVKAKKIWPVFPFESEAAKAETKPAASSSTVQGSGVATMASVYTAQAEVKREIAAANTEQGIAWGKLMLSLLTSEVFLASMVAVVGAAFVIVHRMNKPDVSGLFRK